MRRTSAPALRARIDDTEAHELILSMAVVAAGAETGAARALRAAAPDLAAALARFAPSDWMWAHLVALAADAPAPRDADALLAYLEGLPAREIARTLLGYYVHWFRRLVAPEVMDAAIHGDGAARGRLLGASQPDDPAWQASLRARLEAGPERTKHDLLELTAAWRERAFVPVAGPLRRALRASTSERRRALRGRRAEDVVAAFTGWDYVAEPGITRVVVVPSLVLEGTQHEFEHGLTKFVCVPVTGAAPARVPAALLRPLRALADESRMAIALILGAGGLGAQELAERTGLGLTTVLHHLAVMRRAGLVMGGGRRRPYRLRRTALRALADRVGAIGRV